MPNSLFLRFAEVCSSFFYGRKRTHGHCSSFVFDQTDAQTQNFKSRSRQRIRSAPPVTNLITNKSSNSAEAWTLQTAAGDAWRSEEGWRAAACLQDAGMANIFDKNIAYCVLVTVVSLSSQRICFSGIGLTQTFATFY